MADLNFYVVIENKSTEDDSGFVYGFYTTLADAQTAANADTTLTALSTSYAISEDEPIEPGYYFDGTNFTPLKPVENLDLLKQVAFEFTDQLQKWYHEVSQYGWGYPVRSRTRGHNLMFGLQKGAYLTLNNLIYTGANALTMDQKILFCKESTLGATDGENAQQILMAADSVNFNSNPALLVNPTTSTRLPFIDPTGTTVLSFTNELNLSNGDIPSGTDFVKRDWIEALT